MSCALHITGEYPADWPQTSNRVWAEAGHRCIRCGHPYRKGEHGKGEWTPCDGRCRHSGPFGSMFGGSVVPDFGRADGKCAGLFAQWRIGTVHHLDGNKANCAWWNLLALCQRCHLTVQSRVNPQQPYMLEHSDWFKPYVAAFYGWKYEQRLYAREDIMRDGNMNRLLALERIA